MGTWFSFFVSWLLRVAAWASQTANLFLLAGHHDQTVSARCYVNRHDDRWGKLYRRINTVFFWQKDHCHASHLRDVEFARQVLALDESQELR